MSISLKTETFKNVAYNAVAKLLTLAFSTVANIVLARNLVSSDYGVVGFAMVFINFLAQFSDLGINSAIIQKDKLDEKGLYTGFTIKVFLGTAIFVLSFLISPLLKIFFDNPSVIEVTKLLSLNFMINSFAFIPNALLTRELNYKKLVLCQIGSVITNSTISVILAVNDFNYWSIVIANLCSTAVFVLLINAVKPVKIICCFDKKIASEFIRFGGNLFFSGLIVFAIFNADNLIIGTMKGLNILGYYSVAYNWGSMISVLLSGIVLSVLFPTFARIQLDKGRLRNAYLRVIEYISFIGLLINLSLLIISREFLFFILGHGTDKWLPALTTLKILCVYGIIRAILEPVGSVMLAIGETKQLLVAQIVIAVLEVGLLYSALRYFGIEGVAVLITISYFCAYFVLFSALRHKIGLTFRGWIKRTLPAITAGFIAVVISFFVEHIISFSLMGAIKKLLFFLISYCLTYGLLTEWKMLKEIKSSLEELKYATKQI